MAKLQKVLTIGLAGLLAVLLLAIGLRSTSDGPEPTTSTTTTTSAPDAGQGSPPPTTAAATVGPIGPTEFDCAESEAQIVFVYSVEKETVMDRVIEGFNRLGCGKVLGFELESGVQMSRLAAGWPTEEDGIPFPHLASPSTSLWATEANAIAVEDGIDMRLEIDGEVASLGWAPLVVAMPQSVAEELATDDNTISLQALADRVGTEVAGHPFVLSKTNPEVASTGFMALVASYAATADLTTLDAGWLATDNKTRELARDLEAATPAYGRNSLTVLAEICKLDNQRESPAAAVSALLTEEQLVVDYNRGTGDFGCENSGRPNEPLVAVYLDSPTPVSDHPLLHITRDTVDPDERLVAEAFVEYGLHPETLSTVGAELGIRDTGGKFPHDDPSSLGIKDELDGSIYTNRPRPAAEAIRAIRADWHDARKPFHVHLLVDLSGSMEIDANIEGRDSTRLDEVKVAMTEFVAGLQGPNDAVAISVFPGPQDGVTTQLALNLTVVDEDGVERIQEVINGLTAAGGTPLYDAIDETYNSLSRRAAQSDDAITMLVVLTDGVNDPDPNRPRDRWTPEEIAQDTEVGGEVAANLGRQASNADPKNRVRIFTIGYGPDAAEGDAVLREFAAQTFGLATQSETSEIARLLRSIINSI